MHFNLKMSLTSNLLLQLLKNKLKVCLLKMKNLNNLD